MRKTKHEIIDEIAAHYNLTNRSIDTSHQHYVNACMYNGPDGKHCAFAYMCVNPADLAPYQGDSAKDILRKLGDLILKEQYRGHSEGFYQDLQIFHDCEENFTDTGLSPTGMNKVQQLKTRHSDSN